MKWNIQIVTILLLAAPEFAADSSSGKVTPKLASVAQIMPEAELDVIVRFTKAPGKAEQEFLTKHGVKLRKLLPSRNSAAYSLQAKKLDMVCENPMIEKVSFDASAVPGSKSED